MRPKKDDMPELGKYPLVSSIYVRLIIRYCAYFSFPAQRDDTEEVCEWGYADV